MLHPRPFGYRTEHTKWWDLAKHHEHEVEDLGNTFPDISMYPDHEGIWVTHRYRDAKRYGEDVREVDLTGAVPIHEDGDGGYMYVRPKRR